MKLYTVYHRDRNNGQSTDMASGIHLMLYENVYEYANLFLRLTVSRVITVHTLRKKGEIKTLSFITRFPSSLVP